jgi:hypothetical protein
LGFVMVKRDNSKTAPTHAAAAREPVIAKVSPAEPPASAKNTENQAGAVETAKAAEGDTVAPLSSSSATAASVSAPPQKAPHNRPPKKKQGTQPQVDFGI